MHIKLMYEINGKVTIIYLNSRPIYFILLFLRLVKAQTHFCHGSEVLMTVVTMKRSGFWNDFMSCSLVIVHTNVRKRDSATIIRVQEKARQEAG
jgi:hypothetical protein